MNPNSSYVNIVEQPGGHTATRINDTTWSYYSGPSEYISRNYLLDTASLGDIVIRYSFLNLAGPHRVYRVDLEWGERMVAPVRILDPIGYILDQPGRSLFFPTDDDGDIIHGIRLIIPRSPNSVRRWTVVDIDLNAHSTYILSNGRIGDYVFSITNPNLSSTDHPEGFIYRIQLNEQGMQVLESVGPITPEFVHSLEGVYQLPENEDANIISDYEGEINNNLDDDNISHVSTLDTFHTPDTVLDNDIGNVTSADDNDTVGGKKRGRKVKVRVRARTRKRSTRKRAKARRARK